jgi:DNA repair exonuclease SbcCD ATPase subunit
MSGTLFVIGEIVLYLAAATVIGLLLGRLTARIGSRSDAGEVAASRRRTATLESEVGRLESALSAAQTDADRAAMAEREAEGLERRLREASEQVAELQAERDALFARLEPAGGMTDPGVVAALEERLVEAADRIVVLQAERNELIAQLESVAADPESIDGAPVEIFDDEEMAALRLELERRRAEIARLERVAADAARLEQELVVRNHRIGDLEARLEATAAAHAITDGDAASIGVSMGAGNYADSRLEFDPWDASDA